MAGDGGGAGRSALTSRSGTGVDSEAASPHRLSTYLRNAAKVPRIRAADTHPRITQSHRSGNETPRATPIAYHLSASQAWILRWRAAEAGPSPSPAGGSRPQITRSAGMALSNDIHQHVLPGQSEVKVCNRAFCRHRGDTAAHVRRTRGRRSRRSLRARGGGTGSGLIRDKENARSFAQTSPDEEPDSSGPRRDGQSWSAAKRRGRGVNGEYRYRGEHIRGCARVAAAG